MIVNTTKITMRPENRTELLQTIWPLLAPIRQERGCRAFRFYIDSVDEDSAILIGEWETKEDWSNHLRSRDFAVLLGAITVLSSPASVQIKLFSSIAVDSDDVKLIGSPAV